MTYTGAGVGVVLSGVKWNLGGGFRLPANRKQYVYKLREIRNKY